MRSYDQPRQHIKKQRCYFATKVHIFKAMVFPVVMYGCKSCTVTKAECQRIDVFELWCWRRLLRVLWNARRSNQSILKEINPEHSLEGLTLAIWCEELTHWKRPWCWERLKAGGEGDDRGWYCWMASLDVSLSKLWRLVMDEKPGVLQSMGLQSRTWLAEWTELTELMSCPTLCNTMDSSMPCNPPWLQKCPVHFVSLITSVLCPPLSPGVCSN